MKIRETKYRSYVFGSLIPMDRSTLEHLIYIFENAPDEKPASLEGRAVPGFLSIPEAGPVVIKFYRRGGWLSRVNRDRYLRIGKSRCRREFESLLRAEKAGVSVPSPVAFVRKGALLYKAWLITAEITGHTVFMRLCREQQDKAVSLLPQISSNIRRLIENGIFHVDLHPGNIIVDKNGKSYILDFDKARDCFLTGTDLAEKYRRRWVRAVRKYRLPESLINLNLNVD